LGVVEEFKRLQRLAPPGPVLKASVPGPYTLSGRLLPGAGYADRYALTEALYPIVSKELADLVAAGCEEITVDEPSMSCYAHREDPARFVEIFNRTVAPAVGKCVLGTHLCFGNYKARAVGLRRYAPMFPAFHRLTVDEIHLEMASREFAEIELIGKVAESHHVAVGIIDVKSYYLETPEDVADRVQLCLKHAPPERLSFAPDCGLSQTARWAAKQKLQNLVQGVRSVRRQWGFQPDGDEGRLRRRRVWTPASVGAGATPTFGIFAAATGSIPFDPALNRVFFRVRDQAGQVIGATSLAVSGTP
jgi:5-methyltetrahydropteroyltriglutamate--homocysteine methyltransferase